MLGSVQAMTDRRRCAPIRELRLYLLNTMFGLSLLHPAATSAHGGIFAPDLWRCAPTKPINRAGCPTALTEGSTGLCSMERCARTICADVSNFERIALLLVVLPVASLLVRVCSGGLPKD